MVTSIAGLPGGYRYYDGTFGFVGNNGYWWSSAEGITTNAWLRSLAYNDGSVKSLYGKAYGFSVRCLRD